VSCSTALRAFATASLLVLVWGCVDSDVPAEVTLSDSTLRADGSPIYWQLAQFAVDAYKPVLLVAQGSGCAPARRNANVATLATHLPEFAVLTIEKYGVDPAVERADPVNDCSADYHANHTVTQRVEDARRVLQSLRERGLWNGRLVLFGGSEGGAVVSILAHETNEVDATVVFSTGTGLTVAEFLPVILPPPVVAMMTAVFDQARANPRSSDVVGGNALKWWADILDRRLVDDLLASSAPILLVHGVNDREAPVAAARATRDAFAVAGQAEQLTYWELADRDHQMRDVHGVSHLEAVLSDVAAWVRAQALDDNIE
jgi:pimeloyl-ACP methyl ester carboxylesterase